MTDHVSSIDKYKKKESSASSTGTFEIKIYKYHGPIISLNSIAFRDDILKKTLCMNTQEVDDQNKIDIFKDRLKKLDTRVHLIQMSLVPYIDTCGAATLLSIYNLFNQLGIKCYLVECKENVLKTLESHTSFHHLDGRLIFVSSIDKAVASF